MSNYQPTENNNLRKDGEVDQRTQQDSFAHGKVDPVEAGKKGGQTGGSSGGQSTGENQGAANLGGDGLKKDGTPDMRLKENKD